MTQFDFSKFIKGQVRLVIYYPSGAYTTNYYDSISDALADKAEFDEAGCYTEIYR